MSTRTVIELNHDYMRELQDPKNFEALLALMRSCALGNVGPAGDVGLPGIRVLGQRHHSEPEFRQTVRRRVP
jgi:hypothetical protein